MTALEFINLNPVTKAIPGDGTRSPWREIPDLTFLIRTSQSGDDEAAARLLDITYPFLKPIAARLIRGCSHRDGLEPQDLIHNAWLTRVRSRRADVTDRGHYLALLTMALRGELIDHIRRVKSLKRTSPSEGALPQPDAGLPREYVLALDREIHRLERIDQRAAGVIRLRYYGGCSWEETAHALGITIKVARGDWGFAVRWLGERLGKPLQF
jgi:RNA polymerase sigma factor (TIGR02999 family)